MNRSNYGRSHHASAVAPSFPEMPKYPLAPEKDEKKLKSKKKQAAVGSSVTLLPRSATKSELPRRSRSASTSPSAWALSPGRKSPTPPPPPKSTARSEKSTKQEAKIGVSGVWKYFSFRQKKVSPVAEEEYHRYRVAYNRLLQWRFANARAEASMAAAKRATQKKALNLWATISTVRKITIEKRIIIQKSKQEIKLHNVLKSEMKLLEQWSKSIQRRNEEGVGRVVRKLSAISTCLPLDEDVKADTMSVHNAISDATEVMDSIKTTILDAHWHKLDRTCFLLTEVSVTMERQLQLLQALEKIVTAVGSLEVKEKSLRAHHIQMHKEYRNNDHQLVMY